MSEANKEITVSAVSARDRARQRQFIQFPHNLYAKNKNWVPFLNIDMRSFLTRKHPYYQNYPAQFFVAERDSKTVGTLSVSYNHAYNQSHKINTAHFFFYEIIDDYRVTEALFRVANSWARAQGAEHIMGPFFSGLGVGSGLLVEGFEYPATMTMMRYNFPYYEDHLNKLGFKKHADLCSYACHTKGINLDSRIDRVAKLVMKRGSLVIKQYRRKGQVLKIAKEVFDNFLNKLIGSYQENYPLPKNEMDRMIKDVRMIIRTDLWYGIEHKGQLVGYALGFPDITKALQKSKGRITPVSILRIIRCKRNTSSYICNGIGILPEYQKLGGSALIYVIITEEINKKDPSYIELTQINEKTKYITNEMAPFIKKRCKLHRILIKSL